MDEQKFKNLKADILKLIQSFAEEKKDFSSVRLEPLYFDEFILVLEADWFGEMTDWDAMRIVTSRLYHLRDTGLIGNDTLKAINAVRTVLPSKDTPKSVVIFP